uniref:Uncharacterized protein n=1 Tax=Brassica campestris TaxID=3711 RepID=A0A3P6A3F5_BRACM|nr:unnamed protein product [Brassica rapa]
MSLSKLFSPSTPVVVLLVLCWILVMVCPTLCQSTRTSRRSFRSLLSTMSRRWRLPNPAPPSRRTTSYPTGK